MPANAGPGDSTPVPFPPLPPNLQQYLPGWPPKIPALPFRRPRKATIRVLLGALFALVLGIVVWVAGALAHARAVEGVGALLFLVGLVVLVGLLARFSAIASRLRAGMIPEEARVMGLRFSPTDPFGLADAGLPFEPFRLRGVQVRNVMWGTVAGVPLQGFDLRHQIRTDKGWEEGSWRFMALAPLAATCPVLWMRTSGTLSPPDDLPRVQFESIDFNKWATVLCADSYFATTLVDERMMAWVLDEAPKSTSFEVRGGHVLARSDEGGDKVQLMIGLSQFVQHMPTVIRSLYPLGGPPTVSFRP